MNYHKLKKNPSKRCCRISAIRDPMHHCFVSNVYCGFPEKVMLVLLQQILEASTFQIFQQRGAKSEACIFSSLPNLPEVSATKIPTKTTTPRDCSSNIEICVLRILSCSAFTKPAFVFWWRDFRSFSVFV